MLRIRAGDVFNQRLFEESIDELNKSGRFKLIYKGHGTEITKKEEKNKT